MSRRSLLLAGPPSLVAPWVHAAGSFGLGVDVVSCGSAADLLEKAQARRHPVVVNLAGWENPPDVVCLAPAGQPGTFECPADASVARPVLQLALALARERESHGVTMDLQALTEHLPFDVWARDTEDRVTYANPTARRHWKMFVGDELDKGDAPGEVKARWRANNARARSGEVVTGRVPYKVDQEDGVYFNIIAPVMKNGVVQGTVGVNVDVTPQARAEKKALAVQELITLLFDSNVLAVGIREVAEDDLIHVANNRCVAALLGRTADELRGRSERSLGTPPAAIRRAIQKFRAARDARRPAPFAMDIPGAGGVRSFVGRVAPLPAGPGEPERYLFFAEDFTDVRTLQSQLMHAERLASLGTLAASIGHEIKNPATALTLGLNEAMELLTLDAGPLKPADRALVTEMTRAGIHGLDRIVALVRDLMELARPEKNVVEPVDIRTVVESVLALTAGRTRGRVELIKQHEDVPSVLGHGVRLAQVLLNLVLNALNALQGHGRLWVTTTSVGTDRVRVDVADDGPGVAPEVRERLFQPFVSAQPGPHHTGLGLYICRQIVDSLEGTLALLPRPGGGTIARVELRTAPRA